jgi:hypothetical protein
MGRFSAVFVSCGPLIAAPVMARATPMIGPGGKAKP